MAMTYNHTSIATTSSISSATTDASTSVSIVDNKIQGQMLCVEKNFARELFEDRLEDNIKRELISMLVTEIVNNNCIEFTKMQTNDPWGRIICRARIFVTPNEQVRIIRSLK